MKIDLQGKTALITGGSSGIGEACVKLFSEAGATVYFTYNTNKDNAETLRDVATPIKCDVSSQEACKEAVIEAASKSGKLDILVNNAGIFVDASLESDSYLHSFEKTIAVNLASSASLIHFALPYMKNSGGKIVNISSILSAAGSVHASAYHASKAGMDGLTRSLAVELAPYNIQVNSIGPGPTLTPMWGDTSVNAFAKEVAKRIPARRFGKPEEVAYATLFMASPFADFITGQTLFVDGGILMNVFKQ